MEKIEFIKPLLIKLRDDSVSDSEKIILLKNKVVKYRLTDPSIKGLYTLEDLKFTSLGLAILNK